ncbi:iron-sulfur cluster repair di-iron protein [Pelosinus sp. sgz500959]|uniref:iron-sulfur cluster repair di-iron protein n=1 Tax=Pelosinus sp. sgz500959 TaxID=3242472 RepID=UPI00367229C7
MKNKFSGIQAVGQIVAEFPQAAEIFKEHRIDFCCGGDKTLTAAVKELNLNENNILDKLNQAYATMENQHNDIGEVDWREESLTHLVDHIINTHHLYLQREMPQISEYVTKILRVHGVAHSELRKVHKLFHLLKLELEQHLIKEEEILFPLIKQYEKMSTIQMLEKIRTVTNDIESEHELAGDIIKELRKITNQYALPADACASFRVAYQKLEEMESDLFQHIHLENNILHPRLLSNA